MLPVVEGNLLPSRACGVSCWAREGSSQHLLTLYPDAHGPLLVTLSGTEGAPHPSPGSSCCARFGKNKQMFGERTKLTCGPDRRPALQPRVLT